MPTLAEVMEGEITNAPDKTCPRCGKRVVGVQVSIMLRRRALSKLDVPGGQSGRSLRSFYGPMVCRACGHELVDQIEQLLGVKG